MTKRHRIQFPSADVRELRQDEVYFYLLDGEVKEKIRLHDYDRIFSIPGLYEQVVYERLKCQSPKVVADVLRDSVSQSQQRLSELKTLMGIGKSVAALGRPEQVFDRVVRAAMYLTQAEAAGLYLADGSSLVLRAGQNLSRNLMERMGQPVEDQMAALVMRSQ